MVSIIIPPLFTAIGAKSRELSQVIFWFKSKFLSYLVFLDTQRLISKFLQGPAAMTDHIAMATFFIAQGAFHKSTKGQYFVDELKSTKQLQYAINSNMVKMLAFL
jgi:hypothetical protein